MSRKLQQQTIEDGRKIECERRCGGESKNEEEALYAELWEKDVWARKQREDKEEELKKQRGVEYSKYVTEQMEEKRLEKMRKLREKETEAEIRRSLLRLVLRSRLLVHAPMLNASHQQRRLEFSYRYRNWSSNERRQDGGIYQQDIAKCHTTDSVRAWFKEHQDQFIVLPSPENSPDLSPINNLWNPLDRVVRVMDPHARNLVQQ
ncbi:transposable element Tcb1 transposase [Trichonephila clavipes]|nr:transposable element Tcb1 transposase [Trichonephila clavipes]